MKAFCAELRMKILHASVLKNDLEVCLAFGHFTHFAGDEINGE